MGIPRAAMFPLKRGDCNGTLVLLVLIAAGLAGCGSAGSGANEEIAFVVSGPGETTHIVAVDGDGNQRRDITPPSDPIVGRPAWSPIDPDAILVDARPVSLVDPTNGGRRPVAIGSSPVWSPDGKRVALFRRAKEIVIVSPSGEQLQQIELPIEPTPVDSVDLVWSPTRSELAVALTPETASGFSPRRLYRVPLDGGEPRLLVEPGESFSAPTWLPNGDKIAYRIELYDDLWTIGRDGGRPHKLERSARAVAWSRSGLRAVAALEADGLSSILIGDKRVLTGPAVAGRPNDLAWSPAGDALAVATEKGAFLFASDGRRLSRLEGEARSPSFSSDGSRVAVLLDSELVVADRDGRNRRNLSRPHSDKHPVWSPDGTRIAFERDRPQRLSRIVVANAEGSGERELGEGSSPQWARDGSAVVAIRPEPTGPADAGPPEIWLLDADGEGHRKIADGMYPSVSTDGTRVAFVRYTSVQIDRDVYTESSTLFSIGVDGTGLRRIASTKGTEAAHFSESAWLPGDRELAVHATSIVDERLFLVSVDGRKEFVSEISSSNSAFSAHGASLAFLRDHQRSGELVIQREGDETVRVRPPEVGHFHGPLSWSRDGRKLALMVSSPSDRGTAKEEIYVVDSDGSGLKRIAEANRFDGGPAWRPRPARR
jgi:Tol biopolymer transport system component